MRLGRVVTMTVAIVAVLGGVAAAQGNVGASARPLTISAACQVQGDATTLHVRVQNRSDRPAAILVGKLVGKEQTQVVDSLFVMATRLATGAAEDFAFVNPKHAMLTGTTAPWIVTIPAAGTYELDAPVGYFVSRLNYSFLEPLGLPGTRILLDARAVPGNPNVWAGEIEAPIEPCR